MRNYLKVMGLLIAGIFLLSATLNAEVKLAYVDLQKAINSVDEGKKANEDITKSFTKKKEEFATKESELKKMKEDLDKNSAVLSEQVKSEKSKKFQQMLMEYQQETAKAQRELQEKETQYIGEIVKEMKEIVQKLAKERSYTMVFEKTENGILYALDSMNITSTVIDLYNKAHVKKTEAKSAEKK